MYAINVRLTDYFQILFGILLINYFDRRRNTEFIYIYRKTADVHVQGVPPWKQYGTCRTVLRQNDGKVITMFERKHVTHIMHYMNF